MAAFYRWVRSDNLSEGNTNKLIESVASIINNMADLFININGCFLGEKKIKNKKLLNLIINVKLLLLSRLIK